MALKASHAKPTRPQSAAHTGALRSTLFQGSGGTFAEERAGSLTSMLAAMYSFSAWKKKHSDDRILRHY